MYGAALRTSEALSLIIGDVDLSNAVLTVRDSKFFKTRLVPIGRKTAQVLAEYASWRDTPAKKTHIPFFVGRNGKPAPIYMFERAFKQSRVHAGLHREGGPRCQPRHDLRHTSAVHRLTAWYREGRDAQKTSAAAVCLPGTQASVGNPGVPLYDTRASPRGECAVPKLRNQRGRQWLKQTSLGLGSGVFCLNTW